VLWDRKDKEKLPESLRELSAEQLAAKLQEAEDAKAKLAAAEQARADGDAKLSTLQSEFDSVKSRMETIEANARREPKEVASIFADPDKYISDATKDTRDVALLSGMMSAKMYCKNSLAGRDIRIFAKYETEIDKIVGSYAPEFRIMPQTWLNALIYTKGLHDKEIQKAEEDRTDFFAEAPSAGVFEQAARGEKLSQEEIEICKKFHWDPAKYLANRQKGTKVGDHVSYK
jgi:hypothetical protein